MGESGRLGDDFAASRPVAQHRAIEQLEHAIGDKAAAIVAHVDDQTVLERLRIEPLEQLAVPFIRGIGQMDVAHAAIGGFFHIITILLHPIEVTEIVFVGDGLDLHLAGLGRRRQSADLQGNGGADGVLQRLIEIFRRTHLMSVDGNDIIADLDVDARLGQRRAPGVVPVLAGKDFLDAIIAPVADLHLGA